RDLAGPLDGAPARHAGPSARRPRRSHRRPRRRRRPRPLLPPRRLPRLVLAPVPAVVGTAASRPPSARRPRARLVAADGAGLLARHPHPGAELAPAAALAHTPLAARAIAIAAALATGMHFHWHPDGWAMLGNVFSNFYEELFYRGLVFAAAWYATGSALAGAAVSGWAFGYTHAQFPMPLRVLTGVVGALWSWAYARTGNLLAPYVAHELSDIILDAIL